MHNLALVALGGAIGAAARYLLVGAVARAFPSFPGGTLAVNVVGSFLMGLLAVALADRAGLARLSPLLLTGLLGGFTTFSAFALDAVALFERGRAGTAAAYAALSVAGSIGALVLGAWTARRLLA